MPDDWPSEVGEELTLDQLKPETVVALRASHRPKEFVTAWFHEMDGGLARFEMFEIGTTFFACVRNGKLFDDMNHQVHVHRYLGEV